MQTKLLLESRDDFIAFLISGFQFFVDLSLDLLQLCFIGQPGLLDVLQLAFKRKSLREKFTFGDTLKILLTCSLSLVLVCSMISSLFS